MAAVGVELHGIGAEDMASVGLIAVALDRLGVHREPVQGPLAQGVGTVRH
jgi:hypothetical protein